MKKKSDFYFQRLKSKFWEKKKEKNSGLLFFSGGHSPMEEGYGHQLFQKSYK